MTKTSKISSLVGSDFIPYRYSNCWDIEKTTGPERLVIGAESNQVELMLELAQTLTEPFGILYVLLVSRKDHEPARYQCPYPCERDGMESFFRSFKNFFESDGRHHIWVMSLSDSSTLVYDKHDVIYAYGPLPQFERVLDNHGLKRGVVCFPDPHSHHYNAEFDEEEQRLLDYWAWRRSPLQESDKR